MPKYFKAEPIPGRQRNRSLIDYTGQTFGRLTAVRMIERDPKWNAHRWLFKCACGGEHVASITLVRRGNTSSCGCLFTERMVARNTTHGLSKRPEYKIWKDMRARCSNPNDSDFHNYGGRGIKVCERWDDFAHFFTDMGPRPPSGTVERKDVNGDYEPDNCIWDTWEAQANNKRTNVNLTMDGKTQSLTRWCRHYGIERRKVSYRLRIGMSPTEAFADVDYRR